MSNILKMKKFCDKLNKYLNTIFNVNIKLIIISKIIILALPNDYS